jgi:hypothetical protein
MRANEARHRDRSTAARRYRPRSWCISRHCASSCHLRSMRAFSRVSSSRAWAYTRARVSPRGMRLERGRASRTVRLHAVHTRATLRAHRRGARRDEQKWPRAHRLCGSASMHMPIVRSLASTDVPHRLLPARAQAAFDRRRDEEDSRRYKRRGKCTRQEIAVRAHAARCDMPQLLSSSSHPAPRCPVAAAPLQCCCWRACNSSLSPPALSSWQAMMQAAMSNMCRLNYTRHTRR